MENFNAQQGVKGISQKSHAVSVACGCFMSQGAGQQRALPHSAGAPPAPTMGCMEVVVSTSWGSFKRGLGLI